MRHAKDFMPISVEEKWKVVLSNLWVIICERVVNVECCNKQSVIINAHIKSKQKTNKHKYRLHYTKSKSNANTFLLIFFSAFLFFFFIFHYLYFQLTDLFCKENAKPIVRYSCTYSLWLNVSSYRIWKHKKRKTQNPI